MAAGNSSGLAAKGRPREAAQVPREHCSDHAQTRYGPGVLNDEAGGPAEVDCTLGRPDGGGGLRQGGRAKHEELAGVCQSKGWKTLCNPNQSGMQRIRQGIQDAGS